MKRLKAWGAKIDWEFVLASAVMALLVILLVLIFSLGVSRASACLTVDVPPQAVIGQPDGDTFYLFNFAPGGRVKIRVQGVDTPERNEPLWAEAKQFTAQWLTRGTFRVMTCGKPTLDRIEAQIERNGENLGDALRQAGLAKP